MQPTDRIDTPIGWEPHRALLHGIQDLRKQFGDFAIQASDLRITDPSPAGIGRQLDALRARLRTAAAASRGA
jgi:hypothetical protein